MNESHDGSETRTIPPAAVPSQQPTLPHTAAAPTCAAPSGLAAVPGYEILRELGRGGMGVVYQARQVSLDRIVAIKMILSGQLAGTEDMQRFRLEAQTAAALQHPNIVAIHEVGEHQGQHYFSMDFVEGRSLADLVRDSPLPPDQAARWVRTIAGAIQYAHQRGVLHRDLKPSNVLIDGFGQPRVTDFGLAKRIDKDPGLTATGAVVGTPSYMPPEQASADRGAMGPASDVYSLGAVLYELLTGRPPFRAATPLDTLLQVLNAEPAPPRLLNTAVSRDLETIVLKCLQKEPDRRYASAQELADDLGAFLEGRPIKARRPGLLERALRWAQAQRRSAALMVLTAVASVLLLGGGVLGWNWYAESRLGYLTVRAPGSPYEVEVFDDESRSSVKPFPTGISGFEAEAVKLPAGDYEVRLSAPEERGETYQLLVQRGGTPTFNFAPESRRLWPSLGLQPGEFAEVIESGDRADIVVSSKAGLRRLSGATLEPVKDWGPGPIEKLVAGRRPEFRWDAVFGQQARPWLVQPGPIVEGERLLVWASHVSSFLLAVSSKTGRVRWWHWAEPQLPAGLQEAQIDAAFNAKVLTEPVVGEIDGKPVLIAAFASEMTTYITRNPAGLNQFSQGGPEEWVEALDADTGQMLWRHSLRTGDAAQAVLGAGKSPAVGLFPVGGRPTVAVVADGRILGLDLRTGKEAFSHDLEPLIGRSVDSVRFRPRFASLGSPPEPCVLLGFQPEGDLILAAVSLKTGQPLWRKNLGTAVPSPTIFQDDSLVVDLDGDGAPEVIIAYPPKRSFTPQYAAVAALNGATGELRWLYQFPAFSTENLMMRDPWSQWMVSRRQIAQVTVGPDLDGDGKREVFVASRFMPQHGFDQRLFVEALSGRDGRPLWRRSHSIQGGNPNGQLSWWDQPGPDGWPQLVVPVLGDPQPTTFVLSAGTGRLGQILPNFPAPRQADLDGDGIPDLCATRGDGSLAAVRGVMPEAWRRLGNWQPAEDLDGDGVPDVVGRADTHGGTAAFSGKNGRLLWQREDTSAGQTLWPLPKTCGDIDGDGVPDLLLFDPVEGMSALSGRTGQTLWEAKFKSEPFPPMELCLLECDDLQGKGSPDLVLASIVTPAGTNISTRQLELAVVSLKDGRTRWRQTLSPSSTPGSPFAGLRSLHPALVDLDGDGVLDVVTWAVADDGTFEVRALSGRDGTVLWQQSLLRPVKPISWPWPGVAAGDLGGRSVIVVDCGNGEVWALDAAGKQLWVWKAGTAQAAEPWQRPVPVFLDLRDGGRGVCVSGLGNPAGAVVLDAQGKEIQHIAGLATVHGDTPEHLDYARYFWRLPHGAGGECDLLSNADGKLRLTRGGIEAQHLVWEWPLPGVGDIMEVLGEGEHTTVVVRSGKTAYGLDGATGKERWRCFGPCLPTGLLRAADAAAPPLVLFAENGGATTCRRALEVGPDGRYIFPAAEKICPGPLPEDPRLRVLLPWWQPLHDRSGFDWAVFLLVQAGTILAVVVGRSAAWLLRRRAWVIGLLLCLVLAVVLAPSIWLSCVPSGVRVWSVLGLPPLAVALQGLPALVFVWQAFAWAVQRRLRRAGLLLAASILLSLPIAALWLWWPSRDLGPTQHYAMDGWYAAWLLGAYVTGMLLAIGWLLRAAFRSVRRVGRWVLRLGQATKALPAA